MDTNFPRQIYDEAKKLFPDGTVQTLVCRATGPGASPEKLDAAVRLVHTATGIEVTCDEFSTQIQNFVAAAIRLRIACDKRDT
jgi:protein subunit release factor B